MKESVVFTHISADLKYNPHATRLKHSNVVKSKVYNTYRHQNN